jgi:hypothetical protein
VLSAFARQWLIQGVWYLCFKQGSEYCAVAADVMVQAIVAAYAWLHFKIRYFGLP